MVWSGIVAKQAIIFGHVIQYDMIRLQTNNNTRENLIRRKVRERIRRKKSSRRTGEQEMFNNMSIWSFSFNPQCFCLSVCLSLVDSILNSIPLCHRACRRRTGTTEAPLSSSSPVHSSWSFDVHNIAHRSSTSWVLSPPPLLSGPPDQTKQNTIQNEHRSGTRPRNSIQ